MRVLHGWRLKAAASAVALCVCSLAAAAALQAARCDLGSQSWFTHASRGATVLVVLSPRMPYALPEWTRMSRAATAAGFEVRALRDPRVPQAEWIAAARAAGLPSLVDVPEIDLAAAVDLGLLHHAPSSMIALNGRVHPWPILGVMPDVTWVDLLRSRRLQLERLPCA